MKAPKTIKYYQKKNSELKFKVNSLSKEAMMYQNVLAKILDSENVEEYVNNLRKELYK